MRKTLYLIGLFFLASIGASAQCRKFSMIASGASADHMLGIQNDGTLWAWGANNSGQLGDGTIIDKNIPVQVGSAANWARVSAGSFHSLGIKSDGTLWAWGSNDSGQLGDGTNDDRIEPVQVGIATNWVAVKAGAFHSLGIKTDGSLWAWGVNSNGELGNGDNANKNVPVQIGTASNWVSISAGFSHSVAIRTDGSLWAWGDNQYGQLGSGNNADKNTPVQIAAGSNWVKIDAGGYHTMGIKSGGILWTWGRNDEGQLGDGSNAAKNIPVQISSVTDWVAISAGMYHSMGIRRFVNGTLGLWGGNVFGQLGNGTITDKNFPASIANDVRWVGITAGKYHSLSIASDGQAWAWGNNALGQLGNSSNSSVVRTPVQLGCGGNWVVVFAGYSHSFGIKSDGTTWAWGDNSWGKLGDGSLGSKYYPVQIGTDWASLSAGGLHSLGIKTNGTLWAWGDNYWGELGDGSELEKHSPTQIGIGTDWAKVSAGYYFSVAIKQDGTLWAWGLNDRGQLGVGSKTFKTTPVQVGTDNDWASVDAGLDFTVAIKKNGTIWAWGNNASGQLGDASNSTRTSPVQIASGTLWKSISAGSSHTAAIKSDGSIWAWGWNYKGQLGDGTEINRNTPVRIGSDLGWASIHAASQFTQALKTDGTVWVWGVNAGRLGTGSTTDLTAPTKLGTDTNWGSAVSGDGYSLAIKTNGTLWAWGQNLNGQLGDGTFYDKNRPIQTGIVTGFSSKLTTTATSVTMQQGQYNMFEDNSAVIASVSSEGASLTPVQGGVTTKVWVEATQPASYVKRHFEITPASNANNAIGRVTLYFTQADFDSFNAVNSLDLPTNPDDAAGQENLRIEKRAGVSRDNTGSPGSYPGPPVTITPGDFDFLWNDTAKWWEVSFKVTGFSGFFVKTTEGALPVRLLSFDVHESENDAVLQWRTAQETGASHFDIERSTDAITFETLGQVQAVGSSNEQQHYSFTDSRINELDGTVYYRLRMVDTDGTFALSRIQALASRGPVRIYPNPVKKGSILTVEARNRISELVVRDISGNNIAVQNRVRADNKAELILSNLRQGVYILRFNSGDKTVSRQFIVD